MNTLFNEPNPPVTVETLKAYAAQRPDPSKTSNKIEGIRRLWHDYKSENFFLEGCLAAVLKALGDTPAVTVEGRPDMDYAFLTALSGTLFTQTYGGGEGSDEMSSVLGHSIMPHMFERLGRSYIYIDRETIASQPALVMEAVKTAIDKGIPVMSRHIANVPRKSSPEPLHHPWWCNIGGYGEDGVLYVNVFFDNAIADEHGYCAIKDTLAGSDGLYILGDKQREIDPAELFKQAVHAIPSLVTMPSRDGVSFGRQAYYDWADGLLDDANWGNTGADTESGGDPFEGFLWRGHHAPWIAALTNECYMRLYFGRMAEFFDESKTGESLEAAKVRDVYMKIHARLPEIQKLHGGQLFADRAVTAKPEVRKELAAILREMGDLHGELLALFPETVEQSNTSPMEPTQEPTTEATNTVTMDSIRYIDLPATRFIGRNVMASGLEPAEAGRKYGEMWGRKGEFMPMLDTMAGYHVVAIGEPCALMHFSNREHGTAGAEMHYIVGRFMKAGAPVPEGFDHWDMAATTVALSVVGGEFMEMVTNAAKMTYERLLADGYAVPYPENLFWAEVYVKENVPKSGVVSKLGYLYSCKKM